MFPVRRIWCVGRNYLEHIKEMGQDEREPPFFFAKPADAIVHDGGTVPYPPLTNDLHHEVEMVVALKSRRPQHREGQGARLRVGLRRRHRSHAPRPADRLAQHQAAVGDRQGVRRLRAVRPAAPGLRDRSPEEGPHLAQGQRRGEAGRRSRTDDLERAGDHLEALRDGRACGRRHHHDRHARRRQRAPARTQARMRGRGRGQGERDHRAKAGPLLEARAQRAAQVARSERPPSFSPLRGRLQERKGSTPPPSCRRRQTEYAR